MPIRPCVTARSDLEHPETWPDLAPNWWQWSRHTRRELIQRSSIHPPPALSIVEFQAEDTRTVCGNGMGSHLPADASEIWNESVMVSPGTAGYLPIAHPPSLVVGVSK